jgi:hypothetical protein
VTGSGARVPADSQPEDVRESQYLYLTHRDALSRDIAPCVECFPRYATERRLDEAREDGIPTETRIEFTISEITISEFVISFFGERSKSETDHIPRNVTNKETLRVDSSLKLRVYSRSHLAARLRG